MSTPYPQQPAGQPAAPAQPVQLAPQGSPQVVPQAGAPYSLAPQRQVPEKISRLSFIFAIIGLGVLVLSLLYCAYIVFTAVHSDHPEGGGFVWIIPFAVYMCLLPPINLAGLIVGFLKVGPSVSGRQRMWSLLGSASDGMARIASHVPNTVRPTRTHPTIPRMIDNRFTF